MNTTEKTCNKLMFLITIDDRNYFGYSTPNSYPTRLMIGIAESSKYLPRCRSITPWSGFLSPQPCTSTTVLYRRSGCFVPSNRRGISTKLELKPVDRRRPRGAETLSGDGDRSGKARQHLYTLRVTVERDWR